MSRSSTTNVRAVLHAGALDGERLFGRGKRRNAELPGTGILHMEALIPRAFNTGMLLNSGCIRSSEQVCTNYAVTKLGLIRSWFFRRTCPRHVRNPQSRV